MNTPPDSPSPLHPSKSKYRQSGVEIVPAEPLSSVPNVSGVLTADLAMASSPNDGAHPGSDSETSLPSPADDASARMNSVAGLEVESDNAYLDAEQDQDRELESASSEDVEIYLNDMGLESPVESADSGKAFGPHIAGEPAASESPLLPQEARVFCTTVSPQEATTSPLSGPPLLTPSNRNKRTPLSTNTHSVTEGTPTSVSNSTTDTTIDAGLTTTTTTIATNPGPSPSPSTSTLHPHSQLESAELRTRLLSPVGDLVDSPETPPPTRMSTIPLPDMEDHDDPTTLLPRSMEQMDIREAQATLKRSPQDKARMRGLTVGGGGGGTSFVTPPPSSPLPAVPMGGSLATAPPNMSSFPSSNGYGQQHPVDSNANAVGRGGSIPSTPTMGVMQPTSSYTQSQPLPQLPTFAPALSVIDEGNSGMSKDDLHLDLMGGGGEDSRAEYGDYGGGNEEMQMNKAEMHQQQQRQNPNPNVTIVPVYQQYGTITVSNSVVSFPNNGPLASIAASNLGHSGSSSSSLSSNGMGGRAGGEESGSTGSQQKTPNVYINGLPPHFPEEQLHALAAPFGEVKSVRTFTRHVRDSESGYGFVLFEDVDSAERCIIALRRYRNLHPTFSKQVHKIPGTNYAQRDTNLHGGSDSGRAYHWDAASASDADDEDASFKARMEALADPTSTNLYMEGLPLSTDEPTLSALVAPHRVVSSRFFQTRLSNPPRIIAFVRLETRSGAEEVIERLHGRMVRGWNDPGSRISVRFADTSEQRELRRQERTVKEGASTGEASPARLTIAQAALLNLRGQDLRSGGPSPGAGSPLTTSLPSATSNQDLQSAPVIGSTNRGVDWAGREAATGSVSGREIIGAAREYAVASAMGGAGPHGLALGSPAATSGVGGGGGGRIARLGNGAAGVDYGSAFAGSAIGSIGSTLNQHQHQHQRQYQSMDMGDGVTGMGINVGGNVQPFQIDYSATPGMHESVSMGQQGLMDPTMKALLESLGGGGVDQQQQEELYRIQLERGASAYHQQQPPTPSQILQYPTGYSGSGVASTRTGYTAAEEYIMRAHAESAARQREYGGSVDHSRAALLHQQAAAAAQRKRPSPLDLGRHGGSAVRRDEGGVDIAMGVRGYRVQASLVGMSDEEVFHSQGRNDERDVADQHQHQQIEGQQQDEQGGHQAHTRSTTLPHHQQQQQPHRNSMAAVSQGPMSATVGGPSASGRGQSRHYQHNSLSMLSTTALRTPQHASVATMGGSGPMESQQQSAKVQHQKRMSVGGEGAGKPSLAYRSSYGQQAQSAVSQAQRQELAYDDLSHSPTSSQDSPSLISPALTYSSQTHTPSTMSPATPFFGTFNAQGDGFRGAGVVVGESGPGSVGSKGVGGVEGKPHSLKSRLA